MLVLSLLVQSQGFVPSPNNIRVPNEEVYFSFNVISRNGSLLPSNFSSGVRASLDAQLRSYGYTSGWANVSGDNSTNGYVEVILYQQNLTAPDKKMIFSYPPYFTVEVTHLGIFNPGTLSPVTQTIASGTVPRLTLGGSSGGSGTYSPYVWQWKLSTASTWNMDNPLPALTNTGTTNVTCQVLLAVNGGNPQFGCTPFR